MLELCAAFLILHICPVEEKPQGLNLFLNLAHYPNAVFYFPKHNYIVHFMIQAISKQFAFAYVLQTGEFTIFH